MYLNLYLNQRSGTIDIINMKVFIAALALLTLVLARGVSSYSIGAPSFACDPLSPVPIAHGGNPQTTSVPYTIDVSGFNSNGDLQYTPEQTYTLSLAGNSGELFRGFLIQARIVADDATYAGVFGVVDSDDSQLSACSRNTSGITHTNAMNKTSIMFSWTAPPAGTGALRFRFSVVEVREIYWANERTAMLIEQGGDSGALKLAGVGFWTVLLVAAGVLHVIKDI